MSTVTYDLSMSLDGYVTGANRRPDQPLGDGGEQLHTWALDESDATGREVLSRGIDETGAVICGRNTYDDSIQWWGASGPTGPARLPVYVVTHRQATNVPEGGVYTFVTSGIEEALRQARAAASGKNVAVMAGPNVGNQFLRAGLVDVISVHVAPFLFGDGTRLTEILPAHIPLELIEHRVGPHAIHLRYRVGRSA